MAEPHDTTWRAVSQPRSGTWQSRYRLERPRLGVMQGAQMGRPWQLRPDRLRLGFARKAGVLWFAGQGGFGIQMGAGGAISARRCCWAYRRCRWIRAIFPPPFAAVRRRAPSRAADDPLPTISGYWDDRSMAGARFYQRRAQPRLPAASRVARQFVGAEFWDGRRASP